MNPSPPNLLPCAEGCRHRPVHSCMCCAAHIKIASAKAASISVRHLTLTTGDAALGPSHETLLQLSMWLIWHTAAARKAHTSTRSRLTGSAHLCMPRLSADSTRSPPAIHPNYPRPSRDYPSSSRRMTSPTLPVTSSLQIRGIAQTCLRFVGRYFSVPSEKRKRKKGHPSP